jgi:hypothetical protein
MFKSSWFKACQLLAFALLVCSPAAVAQEAAPSEASLRELLEVTGARDMSDTMLTQMDVAMKSGMQQVAEGEPLNDAQRKVIEEMSVAFVAIFKDEMSWDKLEPETLEIYRKSFTQTEVDGMLEFYRSDVGKAVVAKMPGVLESSMSITQARMGTLMPRIKALQTEYAARLAAAK